MRTQTFGWSPPRSSLPVVVLCLPCGPRTNRVPAPILARVAQVAVENYREMRQNGVDEDSPDRPFPGDGKRSDWIKCRDEQSLPMPRKVGIFSKGGFKEGYRGDGHYRVRYEEGPGDRAWMQERDANYLARMEREKAQAETAAALAANVRLMSEQAAKLSHGGEYFEAIKLCDLGLAEDGNHQGLRQQRASYHEALFQQAKSSEHQRLYLEKAIEDYRYCVTLDGCDETSRLKIEEIENLLAQLAGAGPTSAASGSGAGTAPPSAPGQCYRDMRSRSGSGEGTGSAPGLSY